MEGTLIESAVLRFVVVEISLRRSDDVSILTLAFCMSSIGAFYCTRVAFSRLMMADILT
jgi:hypothetical protein